MTLLVILENIENINSGNIRFLLILLNMVIAIGLPAKSKNRGKYQKLGAFIVIAAKKWEKKDIKG